MDQPIQTISNIQLLSDFDQESLADIQKASLIRSFPPETIVLWENEPNHGIHIVKSGWLKAIRSTPTDREQVLSVFGPGDSYGVISALSDTLNQVRVITLETCTIQIIPRTLFFDLLVEHPELAHKLIERLSKSLAHLISLVESLSLGSVETRLAKFLLEQASDGVYNRKKWETQEIIAARIGTVPDVLSRILRDFEKVGWITVTRKQIKLIDTDSLQRVTKSSDLS